MPYTYTIRMDGNYIETMKSEQPVIERDIYNWCIDRGVSPKGVRFWEITE